MVEKKIEKEYDYGHFVIFCICITILGIIDLIGIFWGNQGFYAIGQWILGGLIGIMAIGLFAVMMFQSNR